MSENMKIICPSCGNENSKGDDACSRCGYSLSADEKKFLSLKWVLISMFSLFIFQIVILAAVYTIFLLMAGVESFKENMLTVAFITIPLSVFAGSFTFGYFFRRCTPIDLATGMGIFLLLTNGITIAKTGLFSIQGLAWIPLMALVAYAGGLAAKKLRAKTASRG